MTKNLDSNQQAIAAIERLIGGPLVQKKIYLKESLSKPAGRSKKLKKEVSKKKKKKR
jgi:hypothetical protein